MAAAHDTTVATVGWDELLERLVQDCAISVDGTLDGMRTLASYAELPREAAREVVRRNHDDILAGMRLRRPPQAADAQRIFGELGEVRARQGIAVSDMLAAWRMGQESLYFLASGIVPDGTGRDALLREFLELEVQWVDFAMLAAAEGHRRAELTRAREQQHAQANLIRRLMSGAAALAEVRSAFGPLGLDPDVAYRAVRARPSAVVDVEAIDQYLGIDVPPSRAQGIGALIDGDICGVVAGLPPGPAPVAIGASQPVALHDLERAFRHAGRALDVALTLGAKGVFDLDTLGVQVAVVQDADVGEAMVRRYIEVLEPVAGGDVVLATVERFLANDCSAEVTARELGVHVNTIRHRLSRFETATGRSLRETETLVEAWWALQRRHLA